MPVSAQAEEIGDYPQLRVVNWQGKVDRDSLSQTTKNSSGSVLTLCSISDDVIAEMLAALAGQPPKVESPKEALQESGRFESPSSEGYLGVY